MIRKADRMDLSLGAQILSSRDMTRSTDIVIRKADRIESPPCKGRLGDAESIRQDEEHKALNERAGILIRSVQTE